METSYDYFQFNCIQNSDELNEFKYNLELIRNHLSFFNFTTSKTSYTISSTGFFNLIFPVVKILVYGIVIIMSLVGNFLIVIVITYAKTFNRTHSLFMLNLAICDLAILFSCIWVQLLFVITNNKYWILGKAFCKINSFFQMVSIVSSVLTLSMISCDRYIGIVHPLKSKTNYNKLVYYVIVAVIWIVSFIVSMPTYWYRNYTEMYWSDFIGKFHGLSVSNKCKILILLF
jgi:hypothetical protein